MLAKGETPAPTCTGEEAALHLALDRVASDAKDDLLVIPDRFDENYPVYEQDLDVKWWRDILFEDNDVLLLWNAAFDGIDDPANTHQHGMAQPAPPPCATASGGGSGRAGGRGPGGSSALPWGLIDCPRPPDA